MSDTLTLGLNVASQVLLIGWDWDRHGEDKPGWGIDYYGTAYAARSEQLEECLSRADRVGHAHIAVRIDRATDFWIIGKIKES